MKAVLILLLFSIVHPSFEGNESSLYKYQLVIFEGSDWCTNCRRLEKNILSDSLFVTYLSKERIKLLRVDFPQRKKLGKEQELQNEKLAEQYHFSSKFPEVVLAKDGSTQFRKIQYKNQTPKEFIHELNEKIKILE